MVLMDDEHNSYEEAMMGPDSEKCLEAMRIEMDSMYLNQVWTLVEPPEGVKPIGCKWSLRERPTWMVICKPIKGDW